MTTPSQDVLALTGTTQLARWNVGAPLGTSVVVTYSFGTGKAAYDTSGRTGIAPFSAQQQVYARQALEAWGTLSGIVFVEVPDSVMGQIRFLFTDMTGQVNSVGQQVSGYAHYPGISWTEAGGVRTYSIQKGIGGDVFLNTAFYAGNDGELSPGIRGYSILLHEIGHALGFKHPFEGTPTITPSHDNGSYTVLSYNRLNSSVELGSVDREASRYYYGETDLQTAFDPVSLVVTRTGTGLAEWVLGTELADALFGQAGADTVDGGPGADTLRGGADGDTVSGRAGDDRLVGGAAGDNINGGEGFDLLDYGAEIAEGGTQGVNVNLLTIGPTVAAFCRDAFGSFDAVLAVEGVIATGFDDVLYGTNAGDYFVGQGGADQMVGWAGADTLDGGAGEDVMLGWTGADSLSGGTGDDWLWAGDGADTGTGGEGADVLVGDLPGSSETGADLLIAGLGADILLGGAGGDTLLGGADSSAGSDPGARDWLVGGAGNDLAFGGGGGDVIWEALDLAEGGADTIHGGDGNDLILAGSGADSIAGGSGRDTIHGGPGADTIADALGADELWFASSLDFGDVVSGFGLDDRIVVYPLLGGQRSTAEALAQGYLSLVLSNADTVLRHHADGSGGGALHVVATFLGTAPADLVLV